MILEELLELPKVELEKLSDVQWKDIFAPSLPLTRPALVVKPGVVPKKHNAAQTSLPFPQVTSTKKTLDVATSMRIAMRKLELVKSGHGEDMITTKLRTEFGQYNLSSLNL